jgi:hypothetical protein
MTSDDIRYLKDIRAYLDFVINNRSDLDRFEVESISGIKYTIVVYKAVELEPVRTFICIHRDKKNKSYYLVANNIVDWGDTCKVPAFVKNHCERLLKLSTFI